MHKNSSAMKKSEAYDNLIRLDEVYEMLGHYISVDDILSFAKKYPQAGVVSDSWDPE